MLRKNNRREDDYNIFNLGMDPYLCHISRIKLPLTIATGTNLVQPVIVLYLDHGNN